MRRVILIALFLLSSFGPSPGSTSGAESAERPNILWVTSEDNSHHWVGCYGNTEASTPHIDRLAENGIRFQYAYSNAAVCAVARNTLILGRYACGMGTHNMRSRYPVPESFQTYPSYLRDAGYFCVNRSKTDYNFKTDDKSHWDQCGGQAHWRNRAKGQPFFAVFNSTISHESSLFANKTGDLRRRGMIPETPSRDPSSVQLPPHYPDTPQLRQDWVTYMDVVSAMDKQIGGWIEELDKAGVRDNTIIFYYSDHGGILPRAKRYINDTGNHVPLIVSFPEKWKHLAPQGSGSVSNRVVSFIDFPATVLSLAGISVPEDFQGHAFAGEKAVEGEPYAYLFGQRFDARMLRFVRGVTNGEYRYIRNFYPHRHRGIFTGYPHGQVGWRSLFELKQAGSLTDLQLAYWEVPQPVEELYHTGKDPWELNNLAADPAFQEQLETMRAATLSKMREIRDAGIVPEAMYSGLSESGTVFDYVHDRDFPYDEVLEMALAASTQGNDEVLMRALQHEHPVFRFWGATGCAIQSTKSRKTVRSLERLLGDEAPIVRIAAAEALVLMGKQETGVQALVDVLGSTRDEITALEALNVCQALGVMGQVPAETWARACTTGNYTKGMAGDPKNPNLQSPTGKAKPLSE